MCLDTLPEQNRTEQKWNNEKKTSFVKMYRIYLYEENIHR